MTITIALSPPITFLHDIATTALEGGIGYWARAYEVVRTEDLSVSEMTLVQFEDAMEELQLTSLEQLDAAYELGIIPAALVHKVCAQTIENGINQILEPGSTVRVSKSLRDSIELGVIEGDAGEIDADAADVILQLATLGELVYG